MTDNNTSEQKDQDTAIHDKLGPFECWVRADSIPSLGRTYKLKPSPHTFSDIAKRLDIPKVLDLSGKITAKPNSAGMIVHGEVHAVLKRTCVVTLESLDEEIREVFTVRYVKELTEEAEENQREDEDLEPLNVDQPVDFADLLIQQVALTMAPYPRKPGTDDLAKDRHLDDEKSPFDILKQLKNPN